MFWEPVDVISEDGGDEYTLWKLMSLNKRRYEYGHWEAWDDAQWDFIPSSEMTEWQGLPEVRFRKGMFWLPHTNTLNLDDEAVFWRPISPEGLWRREQRIYEETGEIIDWYEKEKPKKSDEG